MPPRRRSQAAAMRAAVELVTLILGAQEIHMSVPCTEGRHRECEWGPCGCRCHYALGAQVIAPPGIREKEEKE